MWMNLFWLDWVTGEGKDEIKPTLSPYEEAMEALSSLITKRSRADKSNKGDKYELLFDYIKVVFPFPVLYAGELLMWSWVMFLMEWVTDIGTRRTNKEDEDYPCGRYQRKGNELNAI